MRETYRSNPFAGIGVARGALIAGSLVMLIGASLLRNTTSVAEEPRLVPPPLYEVTNAVNGTQAVVFAGGCFWGVQNVFQHVEGVTNATAGYSGGRAETATYELTETGNTGHAEAVQVVFDPRKSATESSCTSISRLPTIQPKWTAREQMSAPSIDVDLSNG